MMDDGPRRMDDGLQIIDDGPRAVDPGHAASSVQRPASIVQRWAVPGLVFLLVLAADQLSKRWVTTNLGPAEIPREIPLLGGWLSLVYVKNTGVAFGLFQNMPQVFTVTSLLISAAAIYAYLFHLPNQRFVVQLCCGLILGGALGNVIDRIRYNYVVDFIRVGWWPVFNLADSAISVGVVLLAVFLLFAAENEPEPILALPGDDGLLNDLLSQDVVTTLAPRRAHPGRTDSGRWVGQGDEGGVRSQESGVRSQESGVRSQESEAPDVR